MKPFYLLPLALLLDCLAGDPQNWPHPVRLIGACASWLEARLHRRYNSRAAARTIAQGIFACFLIVGSAAGFAYFFPIIISFGAERAAELFARLFTEAAGGPARAGAWAQAAHSIAQIWLVYVSIAPRDLAQHAMRVARALRTDNIEESRRAVAMIVGRDVQRLDKQGIRRAAIESVAESSIDGVIAPLFWAAILGPAGAFAYRAINTLDSMWGHKNERYLYFGRAAATLDDAASWLPARAGFFIGIGATAILSVVSPQHFCPAAAATLGWRDRRNHESPNAAWMEALTAGALGLRLGGPACYDGEKIDKAWLGESRRPPEDADIGRAVAIMYTTSLLFVAILFIVDSIVTSGAIFTIF